MYRREISTTLESRLREPRRFIQVVMGPRQTGKTTAVKQALERVKTPSIVYDAASARSNPLEQIRIEWEQARILARRHGAAVIFIDEIQKAQGWQDVVKALWDQDSWDDIAVYAVVSGSSTLLLKKGLSDSLKGRFEVLRCTQWSYEEMSAAFGFGIDAFLRFGGYPGAAPLADDEARWTTYMRDSIIDPTIANDILQLENVRKPALLRRVFEMGAYYSSQEFSYRKILGQLDDKGNTDTIAHYVDLLDGAGMLAGLQKHYPKEHVARRSSPRFAVYDTALMTAAWGDEADALMDDSEKRGRLVESAVGASLLNRAPVEGFELRWWRDGTDEVDFVVRKGEKLTAVEVKSGRVKGLGGMGAFMSRFPNARPLVVGGPACSLEEFLLGEVPLF
jgi:predicted AAA+ superfamily ATPase